MSAMRPAVSPIGLGVQPGRFAYIRDRARALVPSPTSAPSPPDEQRRLSLADPAVCVVTDFALEKPTTTTGDLPIGVALRDMMTAGVRALLVVRNDAVIGLITAYDIQGERPLQFLLASNYYHHEEIEVQHIMTRWERVPTLYWPLIDRAQVLDLVSFFRATLATHAVIVEHGEHDERDELFVRGLVSGARLERQLGYSLDQYHAPR
jgi:hypothetical protein